MQPVELANTRISPDYAQKSPRSPPPRMFTLNKVGNFDLRKDDISNPYEVNLILSDYWVERDSQQT